MARRIFINALSMGIGGGRTYLRNLLKTCAAISEEYEYYVLLPINGIDQFSHLASKNVTILDDYRVPVAGWRRILWEQLALPFIVLRNGTDVLVSTGSVDVFIASGLAHVPSVIVVQMNQPWMVPDLLPSKLRVAYLSLGMSLSKRTAKHFVAMSETAKGELCRIFDIEPGRISVIYHGGASEPFSPQAAARQDVLHRYNITKPYILSVSSIFTFKNYHRLVEAYAIVRRELANAPRLLIIGSVKHGFYFTEIERLIDSLELQETVHFLGHVSHEDLPAIYANAEAYVFPSLCETFGLTQIEAMACGVPVATSKVSVMPEICGDAAVYFDPYDPEDMADVMIGVLFDEALREQLIDKGLRRARQFSWEKTAQGMLKILEQITDQ